MGYKNGRRLWPDLDITIYTDGIIIRTYPKDMNRDSRTNIKFPNIFRDDISEYIDEFIEKNKDEYEIHILHYTHLPLASANK